MANFGVDFSPLGDLYNTYQQSRTKATRDQVLSQLGQGGGQLDYNTAARALLSAGDTEGGLSLAKLAQQQYLTSPEYITKSKTAEAEVAQKYAPKTANFKLPGGEEVTAEKGPGGYQIPQIQGMPAPDPNAPQPPPGVDVKKWRETRAAQLGNIDDKAVLEAEKATQASTQAVQSLTKAIELSKKAFFGPLAGKVGYAASLVGNERGVATEELTSTVTNQALENLRATFGGNPTEGERKILLDVQGAVNQAPEVREKIYQNAIEAANKRIEFNKRTAEQMRAGTYLLPEAQRNAPPQPKPQADANGWKNRETIMAARQNPQAAIAEAQAAIKAGADPKVVMQRLQAIGIPMGQQQAPQMAPGSAGAIY